jgi:hypothetical protein
MEGTAISKRQKIAEKPLFLSFLQQILSKSLLFLVLITILAIYCRI